MFDIEKFRALNFIGSKIAAWDNWGDRYVLRGDFARFDDIPYFNFYFRSVSDLENSRDIVGAEIIKFDIDEENCVKILLQKETQTVTLEFTCESVSLDLLKYRGMSYKNLYSVWEKRLAEYAYVECEEYFAGDEEYPLPDGWTLSIKSYSHIENNVFRAHIDICTLTNGEETFRYTSDYNHVRPFQEFIHHKNGHRYFPFHIDLYGISYRDMETGETYHYIPEGYQHDASYDFGESFIITDIHYDPNTNLIAYGGCYWAAPYEVMVGDFSEPLNFNPHLANIHEIVDPDYEEIDDLDFKRFDEKGIVAADLNGKEYFVEYDLIFKIITSKPPSK